VAAALLLTCIVLPAEYGIDRLGSGEALGLRAEMPAECTRDIKRCLPGR
jgi:hypothetical protein